MVAEAVWAGLLGCAVGACLPSVAMSLLTRRSLEPQGTSPWLGVGAASALAIAYATLVLREGLTLWTVEVMVLLAILGVCSLTDVMAWLIPNECVVACVTLHAFYLLCNAVMMGWRAAASLLVASLVSVVIIVIPLLALVLVMDGVLGSESMGGGDLKLFGVGALVFGWQRGILLVLVACVLGVAFGLMYRHAHAGTTGSAPRGGFPFGPAIAVATWLTALFGSGVVAGYLGMLVG